MGGGATRAYNVAKGLKLNGCDVTVISAFPHYPDGNIPKEYRWKPLKVEEFEDIKVIRILVPPLASQGLAKRLVLFLSFIVSSLFAMPMVKGVDIIWAANPNILSIFPVLVYGTVKRSLIALNVDDLWPEDLSNFNLIGKDSFLFKLGRVLARIAYSKASLITPISPGYVKIIAKRYGVSRDKIVVVRAGVDLGTFGAKSDAEQCNGKFEVLYSGAFSVAYDFDQVLLAAKSLNDVEDIEFVFQGRGELVDYVKTKVEELELKNVKVMDKVLSRGEVAKLLSQADALILPLRNIGRPYLGFSSKIYEYQAAGKPIICCGEGQPAEHVKETNSGIIIKPGDHKGLAEAILYLHRNMKITRHLGENGRLFVKDNLSLENIGSKMIVAFNACCLHRRRKVGGRKWLKRRN